MRQRLTWNRRASAHPSYPDEGPASPAYPGADPDADAYENGNPSSWAEDPRKGPYAQSAHPSYPDEGPASPAYKMAALERKAAKCIRIASAMLGRTASVRQIEDQALSLMDLDDRSITATLTRLAAKAEEAEDEAEGEEAEEETAKKASFRARMARLRHLAAKATEADAECEDEAEEEKSAKKASFRARRASGKWEIEPAFKNERDRKSFFDAARKFRLKLTELPASRGGRPADPLYPLIRIEGDEAAVRKFFLKEFDDDPSTFDDSRVASRRRAFMETSEEMLHEMLMEEGLAEHGMESEEEMLHEMLMEEGLDELPLESEHELLAEMLAEEGLDEACGYEGLDESEDELLEELLAEEALHQKMARRSAPRRRQASSRRTRKAYLESSHEMLDESEDEMLAEMLAEEAMMPALEAEELPVESEDEMLAEMLGEDPMGVVEAEMGHEERLLMAKLFGKNAADEKAEAEDEETEEEAEEEKKAAKKASFRPQPRRAANGVTRLGGGVSKEASASNDLSKLWDSAPDVSKYF